MLVPIFILTDIITLDYDPPIILYPGEYLVAPKKATNGIYILLPSGETFFVPENEIRRGKLTTVERKYINTSSFTLDELIDALSKVPTYAEMPPRSTECLAEWLKELRACRRTIQHLREALAKAPMF